MAHEYFAALPPEEMLPKLVAQEKEWDVFLQNTRHFERMWHSLSQVFGAEYRGMEGGTHKLEVAGSDGQLTKLRPNHYRRNALNIHTLITAQQPTLKPRAQNTDARTQAQVMLAGACLSHYMDSGGLAEKMKECAWHSVTLGLGFLVQRWDPSIGPPVVDGVTAGDIDATLHLPFDVMFDVTARSRAGVKWYVVRSFVNKFDLAARYPEQAEDIIALSSPTEMYRLRPDLFMARRNRSTNSDLIPRYEFFHDRTPALPQGRQSVYLSAKVLLEDGPLEYPGRMPVFPLYADTVFDSAFGYTSAFDGLSIQQAVEIQSSAAISNQKNFGVQSVIAARGSGVNVEQAGEGMALLEYDPIPGAEKPSAMQWTETAEEIFTYRQELISEQGIIMGGLNNVTQGTEQRDLSGAAQVMLDAASLRSNSGLQAAWKRFCEEVGSFTIALLQKFATAPRLVQIAGKAKSSMAQEFTGADLDAIDRVSAESVDPMFGSTAGKLQIADNLLEKGLVNASQYLNLAQTGNLETMTEGPESQLLAIKSENERLSQGIQCVVVPSDNPFQHVPEHAAVWASPEARENPEVRQVLWEHLEMHALVHRTTDPMLLAYLQIPPAMPPMAPPFVPVPGQPPGAPPQAGGPPAPGQAGPQPGGAPPGPGPQMPMGPPGMGPDGPAGLPSPPTNPATHQPWDAQTGGLPQ